MFTCVFYNNQKIAQFDQQYEKHGQHDFILFVFSE